MRKKTDTQSWLDFQPSNLKVTNEFYAQYERISQILDSEPELLELVHQDLETALEQENRERKRNSQCRITSEMVFRLVICQTIEGASLRGIVIRVDDSNYLRRFTRFYDGPMMNYSTLDKLRNAVSGETWKALNESLARVAVKRDMISGEQLRLDTTAVETNIHWPTDSSLLNDCYRTLGRLLGDAREIDPEAVGKRRVHLARAKKFATKIARRARVKGRKASELQTLYKRLIRLVEAIVAWASEVAASLDRGLRSSRYGTFDQASVVGLVQDLQHYLPLSKHVIWQATERVLKGRQLTADEKIYSIFEPHTELLKRGKAGKDIEYGHMIQIQQVGTKFITDYEVFDEKPSESTLVDPALASHLALFGYLPEQVAADKGYWSAEQLEPVFEKVDVVSIPKKGRRNDDEEERELHPLFRLAQRFRAGVEGSISFLKRGLRLARCMNKGWAHFMATVGATIFAHNLLILARC